MSLRRGRSGRLGATPLGEEARARVAGLVAKGAGGACLEGEGLAFCFVLFCFVLLCFILFCLAGERAGCGRPGPGAAGYGAAGGAAASLWSEQAVLTGDRVLRKVAGLPRTPSV